MCFCFVDPVFARGKEKQECFPLSLGEMTGLMALVTVVPFVRAPACFTEV